MAHFVAEKRYFNMRSATLLNKTFEVWILLPSLFAWCSKIKSLRWIPTFNFLYEARPNYRTKYSRKHVWLAVKNFLITPPNFHWKHWKSIHLKPDLPDSYDFFVVSAVSLADISSTYNSRRRFNLLVKFWIGLLLSYSQTTFSNF